LSYSKPYLQFAILCGKVKLLISKAKPVHPFGHQFLVEET